MTDRKRPAEAYARLYDDILDNPKIARVGPLGFALYCAGLVYANRNRSDGFIPTGKAPSLLDVSGVAVDATGSDPIDWTGSPRRLVLQEVLTYQHLGPSHGITSKELMQRSVLVPTAYKVADGLVAAGLWEDDPQGGGWYIHDYLKHNASRELREHRSAKARELANRRYPAKGPANVLPMAGISKRQREREEDTSSGKSLRDLPTEAYPHFPIDDPPATREQVMSAWRERQGFEKGLFARGRARFHDGLLIRQWIANHDQPLAFFQAAMERAPDGARFAFLTVLPAPDRACLLDQLWIEWREQEDGRKWAYLRSLPVPLEIRQQVAAVVERWRSQAAV
jgi:hypothetical protein